MSKQSGPATADELRFASLNAPANIGHEVLSKLSQSGYSSLHRIGCDIDADGQTVRLHGLLPSYYLKQMAQEIAGRATGVLAVRNQIEVLAETGKRLRNSLSNGEYLHVAPCKFADH